MKMDVCYPRWALDHYAVLYLGQALVWTQNRAAWKREERPYVVPLDFSSVLKYSVQSVWFCLLIYCKFCIKITFFLILEEEPPSATPSKIKQLWHFSQRLFVWKRKWKFDEFQSDVACSIQIFIDYQIPFSQLCFLSAELILYVILILIIFGQLFTEFVFRLSSSRSWSKLHENERNDSYWISDQLSLGRQFFQCVNPCYCSPVKFIFLKTCLPMYAIRGVFVPVTTKNYSFSWWLLFFWVHHLKVLCSALLSDFMPTLYPTYWQQNKLKLCTFLYSLYIFMYILLTIVSRNIDIILI